MDEIIKQAAGQGLWALLFVFLLFWVLKENSRRETNYQGIIKQLSDRFESIEKGVERLEKKFEDWLIK